MRMSNYYLFMNLLSTGIFCGTPPGVERRNRKPAGTKPKPILKVRKRTLKPVNYDGFDGFDDCQVYIIQTIKHSGGSLTHDRLSARKGQPLLRGRPAIHLPERPSAALAAGQSEDLLSPERSVRPAFRRKGPGRTWDKAPVRNRIYKDPENFEKEVCDDG